MVMKVLKCLLSLVFVFSFTQFTVAKTKSKIIFNDGSRITGFIIQSKSPDSIFVELEGDFKASYAKNSILQVQSLRKNNSIGIGMGIPYGILGINTEYEPSSLIALSAGIGTTIVAGIAWNVGIIAYFLDEENNIRPRVSLFYGVNSIIYIENNNYYNPDGINQSFTDLSFGIGLKSMVGESHGLTFDLFYLFIDKAKDKISELKKSGYLFSNEIVPISYSIGYQLHF